MFTGGRYRGVPHDRQRNAHFPVSSGDGARDQAHRKLIQIKLRSAILAMLVSSRPKRPPPARAYGSAAAGFAASALALDLRLRLDAGWSGSEQTMITDEQLAAMHRLLADYHRNLAKEAMLDIVQHYHADLAQRLADEAVQIPRRTAILERLHEREQQNPEEGDVD
jgi:hypothetical protein